MTRHRTRPLNATTPHFHLERELNWKAITTMAEKKTEKGSGVSIFGVTEVDDFGLLRWSSSVMTLGTKKQNRINWSWSSSSPSSKVHCSRQ